MRAPVPKASERGSPLCDPVTVVGGGWPKVIRGQRRRKRHGAALQGPPAWRQGLTGGGTRNKLGCGDREWKGGDGTHINTYRDHRPMARTQRRIGFPLLPYPAFLFSNLTSIVVPSQD
ncbi:hypothetical protein EDB83DRAFT_2316617 [Lactarius deliciosus]|nr:hypothetical protein EDB83DRAFT_2316617 [Lactarius deliciosus]